MDIRRDILIEVLDRATHIEDDTLGEVVSSIMIADPINDVARQMREALQTILDCAPCPICTTAAEDAIAAYDALEGGK